MPSPFSHLNRRQLVARGLAFAPAAFFAPGVFAAELARTPRLTEGPFFPDKLPLDRDNDLIVIGDSTTPAVGQITHLTGRLLDDTGAPIKDALIEIWQCDANGVYLHSADSGRRGDQQDKNFQGYGRFVTTAKGGYRFRTIKPVAYPGRPAPHIHFKVTHGDRHLITSQIFVAGEAANRRDGIYMRTGDAEARKLVEAAFTPVEGSKIGALAANFDIVVGHTPADRPAAR